MFATGALENWSSFPPPTPFPSWSEGEGPGQCCRERLRRSRKLPGPICTEAQRTGCLPEPRAAQCWFCRSLRRTRRGFFKNVVSNSNSTEGCRVKNLPLTSDPQRRLFISFLLPERFHACASTYFQFFLKINSGLTTKQNKTPFY